MKKLLVGNGKKGLRDIVRYNNEVFKIKQMDYLVVDKVPNSRDLGNAKINFNELVFLKFYAHAKELVTNFNVIAFGDVLFQALYNYPLGVLNNGHKVTMCLDFAYTQVNEKEKILQYFSEAEKYVSDNFIIVTIGTTKYKFHNIVLTEKWDIFKYIDLQSSMVYYDGEIKTNDLGAYCIGSKVNIYDYKKKINTLDYDARLQQMYFAYGVRIIFLNTKVSHIKNVISLNRLNTKFPINIVEDIKIEHDPYTTNISFDYYLEARNKGFLVHNQLTNDDLLNVNPNGGFSAILDSAIGFQTANNICYTYTYINLNYKPKASEYFNARFYVPFVLIDPNVETLLRLLTKHKIGVFSYLDRNTLNLIFQKLL